MDFSYRSYVDLLRYIQSLGRVICPLRDAPAEGSYVILRHDIDYSVGKAREMAIIEHEEGVRSTYMVLLTSPYYNLLQDGNRRAVVEIAGLGHEIASHGYEHRLVYDMTPAAFRADIKRSKDLLESAASTRVFGYRAPSYSVTSRSLWALDILIEEGFLYDASIFPIHHDRYGIPVSPRHPYVLNRSAALVEAPASTVRWGPFNLPIGGGGYFRILPYAWTRWGIRRLNEVERLPAIFYLHPWEIDPDQPRLSASRLSQFRHYCNLAKTEDRLRALVREFRFSTMMSLVERQIGAPSVTGAAAPLPYVW